MSIRNIIESKSNPAPASFTHPELSGPIFIRRMTIAQMFSYLNSMKDRSPEEASSQTLCFAVVEENGAQVFDYEKQEDRDVVGKLPPKIVMAIVNEFRTLNALGEERAPAAGA